MIYVLYYFDHKIYTTVVYVLSTMIYSVVNCKNRKMGIFRNPVDKLLRLIVIISTLSQNCNGVSFQVTLYDNKYYKGRLSFNTYDETQQLSIFG